MLLRTRDTAITELLDAATLDPVALRRNLGDIRRINALLGWTTFTRNAVGHYVQAQHPQSFTLIDVASGSADIPLAIARWSQSHAVRAQIVATDINAEIVAVAQEQTASIPMITVAQHDALALPYPPGSFDIALCTLALHHFAPEVAIALLRSMARVSKHVMVFDVVRSSLAYAGVVALTGLLRMNYMTRHDGPVSVRRAYSAAEVRDLAQAAGLRNAQVRVGVPFRLALTAAGDGDA